jgi:tellurite resistance protein TerC
MVLADIAPWVALVAAVFVFLWLDLHFFARDGEASFRESVIWSLGWLALGLLVALVVLAFEGGASAVEYTTVYLIERSLSLDNLFVFLLLFTYFGVPFTRRPRLLFWGIVGALVLRAGFILGGTALLHEFHFLVYLLGGLLLVLAYRVYGGVDENVDPDRNLMVRLVRRVYPVSGELHEGHWFVKLQGKRYATPLFLCLVAIVFADLAFAIDSIPAAFAITRDPLLIWMGNVFALLGLRALFVLVESLVARFRYLDETIAVVLGLVAVKLLTEDLVHVGPLPSLGVIAAAFAIGIGLSLNADRRDPHAEEKREERARSLREGGDEDEGGSEDEGGGAGNGRAASGVGGGAVGQQPREAQ